MKYQCPICKREMKSKKEVALLVVNASECGSELPLEVINEFSIKLLFGNCKFCEIANKKIKIITP